MKNFIILSVILLICISLNVFAQSGYELIEQRQRDADYYYIEFKNYFDKQDYYTALKKIEDAIDAATLHYNIAQYYYDKGEIYRKLFQLNQRDSDIEEAYEAYKESARLDNHPQTAFRMYLCLFELQKNDGIKLNRTDPENLEKILFSMWEAILDFEEIADWQPNMDEALDEELHLFLEKCIDAGILSQTPNSYLSKIINTCRRGKNMSNPVVVRQWNEIENKLRIDIYNLPCSGNLYLAHQKALEAIKEQNDRLYDHALTYYRAAADTAQTTEARAFIYNEMAHFVNSAPFFQLYDAVKYAGSAHEILPANRQYAEEYGDFLWLLANHIIKVEIAGKETFAKNWERPKIQRALEYLEKASRFEWHNRIQALVLCSVYYEWLQNPWEEKQAELKQSQQYIVRAFEDSPDKNDEIILNQLVRVNKKLGVVGIRKLRELDEKYRMNISEWVLTEASAASDSKILILMNQIRELQASLYEIDLSNYRRFVEIRNKAEELTDREKVSSEFKKLTAELAGTRQKLDELFAQKVDVLYRIGYSKPQETEIQTLSRQIFADNLLDISHTTRQKVNQISVPDRMLH
jgi:tetratricopeptide (TPR) repeat protein